MRWPKFGKMGRHSRQTPYAKKKRRNSPPLFEQCEQRLAMTITAPVIIDNGTAGHEEYNSLPVNNLTNLSTEEATPSAISDSAGNYYMVYAGGTAGAAHLMYTTRPAGGSWSTPVDLGGTNISNPRIARGSSGYLQVVYTDGNEVFYKSASPGGVWAATLQLSVADGKESSNPDVAVDSANGRIHIVWQDKAAGNLDIIYRRYESGAWQTQETISSRTDDDGAPRVTVGSDGRAYVAWHNTGSKEIYVRERSNAGVWGTITRIDDTSDRSLNPSIAVDSSHNLHVAWHDNASAMWEAAYAKRTSGTWSSVTKFDNPSVTDAYVNVDIGASNRVHLTWTDFTNVWTTSNGGSGWSSLRPVFSQIGAVSSSFLWDPAMGAARYFAGAALSGLTNSGSGDILWNNEVELTTTSPVNISNTSSDEISPAITTDAAGNQYALYAKGSSGSATLQFLYKPNGGSWSSPTDLGGTNVKTPRLDMSSSGYLQVVYVDGNEVYYRSRTPAGVWSAATLISAADSIESINPDIAVDGGNGKIHIVWQDRASGNAQIMYKGFESGAWGANTTISSRSDDDLSPRVEFGTGGQAYVTWYNSGSKEIYFRERSGAGSWGSIARIDTNGNTSENPNISVGSGYVHIAWHEQVGSDWQIARSSRAPSGVWSAPMFFNSSSAADKNVSIATLPGQFNVMSWSDGNNLFVTRSVGSGWGQVVQVVANMGITYSTVEVNPTNGMIEILYQAQKTGVTNANSWDVYKVSVAPNDVLGDWATAGNGYNSNSRVSAATAGIEASSWTFTGLQDGIYTIEASWVANAANATNAMFSVVTNGQVTNHTVNQQNSPLGTTAGGIAFQPLTSVYVTGGTLRVFLNDRGNGRVVADAVRIVPPYTSVTSYGTGSRAVYPDAVADSAGNLYAVYAGGTDNNLHVQFVTKAAGSSTWSSPVDLGGTNVNTPRLAVDSSGNVHVVYANNNNVYYRKRTGGTWGSAVQLSDGTKSLEADIGVDSSGNVSVIWHCNGDGDYEIRYRRFDAGSSTWLAETQLSNNGDLDAWARLAVGTDSSVHVTWSIDRSGNANDDILYRKWTTGGGWGSVTRVDTGSQRSFNPMIALDSSNQPTIVWHEDVSGDWSAAVSRFNGSTWSTPEFFNVAPGVAEGYATVGIAPNGVVSIVWMDYSDFYIVKNDGPGGSWSSPRKIIESTNADGPPAIVFDPTNGQMHLLAQFKNSGSWNIGYFYE